MAKLLYFNGYLLRQYGAFIRTDISNLVQINGVGTGIIGIVGLSEKGPDNKPVLINSYRELVDQFGDGPLVRHGLSAYVGGANQLVAVRIGNPTKALLNIVQIDGTDTRTYTWEAIEAGTYGNNISVEVRSIDAYDNNTATGTERFDDIKRHYR